MRNHLTLALIAILLCACQPAVRPTPTPLPVSTLTPTPTPTQVFTSTPTPGITPTEAPTIRYSKLTWSPDSKWLAYTNSQGELWLQNRDGKSSHVALHKPDMSLADLFWSPMGDDLLVLWGGLWLIPVTSDGFGTPKLLQDWVNSADWAPDGKRVAFVSKNEGWLYENGQIRQITDVKNLPAPSVEGLGVDRLIWSPDGRQLYFNVYSQESTSSSFSGVIRIDLASGKQDVLKDKPFINGFSPDGKMFLIHVGSNLGDPNDYFLYDSLFQRKVNLTRSNPDCDPMELCDPISGTLTLTLHDFSWGPDGHYLYNTTRVPFGGDGTFTGFIVRASPEKIIADHRGDPQHWYFNPVWLKDGRYAYVETEPSMYTNNYGDTIYSVRHFFIGETALSIKPLKLVEHQLGLGFVAWAPDGSALAAFVLDSSDTTENTGNVRVHLEIIPITTPKK